MTAHLDADVRRAARALARHGLVHAYGHVSARLDATRLVVTPARPLGHVGHATPLVHVWDDPLLVRAAERAAAVAAELAGGRAIVLRGNGAVTVGATVREAACHAFFLEDAARLELSVLASQLAAAPYTADQAERRAGGRDPSLYDRMWDYLVGDDAAAQEPS